MNNIRAILDKYLILRYIISGGTASLIDIVLFSTLIAIVGLHYIAAGTISVSVSFVVRFYLQKVFAFRDRNIDIHRQVVMYSILYVLSLVMTAVFLYIFIDILHIWYVLSQIITIGLIAGMSFFVYRHIIFKKTDFEAVQNSTNT